MKPQVQRPDVFNLTLDSRGASLALAITESMLAAGRTVVDQIVRVAGVPLRQISVHGKRPGEGVISADMRSRVKARKL